MSIGKAQCVSVKIEPKREDAVVAFPSDDSIRCKKRRGR